MTLRLSLHEAASHPPTPSIATLVFSSVRTPPSRVPLLMGVLIGLCMHVALAYVALGMKSSMETWSATMAIRVHAALTEHEFVAVQPAEPPMPVVQPPLPKPAPRSPKLHAVRAPKVSTHQQAAPAVPAAPAQAAHVIAHDNSVPAPAEIKDPEFVTGFAETYAGGTTMHEGTSEKAVDASVVDPKSKHDQSDEKSLARPVALADAEWHCPWPKEANEAQIDEQAVLIRVTVQTDGRVTAAEALSDPGYGFANAALACAKTAQFDPATDALGNPIPSQSPPIRVHFSR